LLKSNLLLALVTLLAAFVALRIYSKQHRDEKSNAAQSVFSEVASAENKLKEIRERFFAIANPSLESNKVLSAENWTKYKYLFIKDLTPDEWNVVENFYNNCVAYDRAVLENNSYFNHDVKHIFGSLDKYYYEIVKTFHATKPKNDKMPKKLSDDLAQFQTRFLQNHNAIDYRPQKPINDARVALVALDTNVTLSSAGQKIKKIAKRATKKLIEDTYAEDGELRIWFTTTELLKQSGITATIWEEGRGLFGV